MYKKINKNEFVDAFGYMNRDNNFSYEGKIALFDYLEELEEETGEEIELDVLSLCCFWREMTTEDVASYYNIEVNDVLEYLEEKTISFELENGNWLYKEF